jgi:hypothetical protein
MLLEGSLVPIPPTSFHKTLAVGLFACQLMTLNSYDIGA